MVNEKPEAHFGDAVRQRRVALGLSQEDLAFESGLHRTYISSLERGGRNVGLRNIVALAKALKLNAYELLEMAKL
jgi:transcriptional regulator with XRE-family HTH domain